MVCMCFKFNSFKCHCYLSSISKLYKVSRDCSPCTFKEKAGTSEVQGHHVLHKEFKDTWFTKPP